MLQITLGLLSSEQGVQVDPDFWLLASSWSEVLESVVIDLARGKTKGIKGGLTRITERLLAADGVEVDFEGLVEAIGICDGAAVGARYQQSSVSTGHGSISGYAPALLTSCRKC